MYENVNKITTSHSTKSHIHVYIDIHKDGAKDESSLWHFPKTKNLHN